MPPINSKLFVAILAAVVCVTVSVPAPDEVPASFPMTDKIKAKGQGRHAMQKLIRLKNKTTAKRVVCKAAGTCPELTPPPSVTGAIVPCVGGMAGDYPCSNVDMLAFINFDDLGYSASNVEGNDLWVWHDTANGDDYVIMGTTHGSSFVRVTDPVNPVVLGILKTETVNSLWRDMKVIKNHAYIVSEASSHGMQIFNLTRLRGLESDPSNVFTADLVYDGISSAHNIVANPDSDTVFLVGCRIGTRYTCLGGLHMVDVSNPNAPTFAGCVWQDGYVHDAQCVFYDGPDTEYTGREICYCYNEEDFTIADVTDRENVVIVSRTGYDGAKYTHQGWVTEDSNFAIMNDELDEYYGFSKLTRTYVWNITNLKAPVLQNVFRSSETSIDHNLYIRDNFVHQSNYEAGYRLLTINGTGNLTEVAYFDVFPSSTTASFYGTWSNYPWLDYKCSPYAVVSSIDYGLFILQPNISQIEAEEASRPFSDINTS